MKKLNKRRDVLRVTVPTEGKGVIVPCGREKREVQMGKERFRRAVKGCMVVGHQSIASAAVQWAAFSVPFCCCPLWLYSTALDVVVCFTDEGKSGGFREGQERVVIEHSVGNVSLSPTKAGNLVAV